MISGLLVLLVLGAQRACPPEARVLMESARASAEVFDLNTAAQDLRRSAAAGCQDAQIASDYVDGLVAARAAWREGGAESALAPVRRSIGALDARFRNQLGSTEVARLVLTAAIAAAQSERADMAIWLQHATEAELQQLGRDLPGAPIVSALEMAGEFWLQLYRYDDAKRAFGLAGEYVGMTGRVMAGLGRSSAGLNDTVSACAAYDDLMLWWGKRSARPPEIVAAEQYRKTQCGVAPK